MLAEYGHLCVLCGEPIELDRDALTYSTRGPSVEHLLPRSRGGSDELDNLRPAHRSCNSARGNRPVPRRAPAEDGRAWFGSVTP